ncbi:phosphate/phosphite/phosphonate ABC transporter substrate-binding protein [Marinobacterium sediminicola]|uniref:Phosphonate transport system substrate-binding protein n=1 Tax=Marinobacterium sediminicola TaxID=518898 RepID=A0ABY1RYP9_9GAMM|nr:phosphate/phosphite/phosphonate ABC transporter substrate-binding protein [Marinobacterium sediminicola]ULG68053.1 phosphate/phosphite/phosphonate ABC transporter substrate-binding protein [Marinobacterium sediminicola]SMR73437.1 phosphonate transport system substrate-binding protein [Marinobacterium sediminicola]
MKYILILLLAWFSLPVNAQSDRNRPVYTVGVVPQFAQRKLFDIWQPILQALEHELDFDLELVGSPKIPVFEKKFLAGEYDFAYMNPYHMLKAHDSQGYVPLVRDGSRQLKGVLVVKHDSAYQSVADLNKKIIAFPSPNALGASLLMRADLVGLHDLEFFPRYVQTHSSVYLNVALGQTEAGGGVLSTLQKQPPEVREQLRVIYETRGIPPHPLSAHARVPEEDREAMRQAWLKLAKTEAGRQLMARIPMYQPIHADLDEYLPMREWGLDRFYIVE